MRATILARLFLLSLFGSTPLFAQEKLTYNDHVRPILENRCLNCHSADKKKGGLDLSTYGATMAGGSGGTSIEAGDHKASKLWQVTAHTAEPYMPPKADKIPDTELAVLSKWIDGGVLETATSSARAKKKSDFAMSAGAAPGKPEGPAAMPEQLLLDPVVAAPRPSAVATIAHSPWAPLLAIGSARQVLLYHSETQELLGVLPFPDEGMPNSVRFSRNGSLILAAGGISGKKGKVAIWDVKTGKLVTTISEDGDSLDDADITPDYAKIALGTHGKRVKIYDTASGQKLLEIKKHTDWVTAVAFSPDGVLLATGDRNGGLYVWETATGGEFYNLKGHDKRIAALAWRADSNLLASGSDDGNFIWWEMGNGGQVKKVGSHGGVLALHFAPDGSMLSGGRDGHLRVWDGNAAQKRDWVPAGGAMILSAQFSHDAKNVLTGSSSGEIKTWAAAADGAALGQFLYNPPALDTRIAATQAELEAKAAAHAQAVAAVAAKENAIAALKAETVALAEKIKAAQAQTVAIQEQVKAHTADMAKMQETRSAYLAGQAAAQAQLAAQHSPPAAETAPSTMPDGVQAALDRAGEAEAKLNSLTKLVLENKLKALATSLAKYDGELTARQQKIEGAQKEISTINAQMVEWTKLMPEKEKRITEVAAEATALQPAVQAAQSAMAPAQLVLNKWLAARENKSVLALRAQVAATTETVADLKAEIAEIEAALTAINTKKAATPPTATPEELTQFAAHEKRLPEAKAALEGEEKKLTTEQAAAEAAWQKYLQMLPKA
jgi:hypothetical protein